MTPYISSLLASMNGADKLAFWLLVALAFWFIARRPSSVGRTRWLGDVWKERDLWIPAAVLSTLILSGFFGFLIWALWPIIAEQGVGR
jgi:hypothetical protein